MRKGSRTHIAHRPTRSNLLRTLPGPLAERGLLSYARSRRINRKAAYLRSKHERSLEHVLRYMQRRGATPLALAVMEAECRRRKNK